MKNFKSKNCEKKRKIFKIKKMNFYFSEKKEHWLNLLNGGKNNLRGYWGMLKALIYKGYRAIKQFLFLMLENKLKIN